MAYNETLPPDIARTITNARQAAEAFRVIAESKAEKVRAELEEVSARKAAPRGKPAVTSPQVPAPDALSSQRVQRDGDRDLVFTARLIGLATVESGRSNDGVRERRVAVTIFVTKAGKLVGHVHRRWSYDEEYRDDARVCTTGEELLAFLQETNNGTLGQASRDAWNQACAKHPPLAPFEVEMVE